MTTATFSRTARGLAAPNGTLDNPIPMDHRERVKPVPRLTPGDREALARSSARDERAAGTTAAQLALRGSRRNSRTP